MMHDGTIDPTPRGFAAHDFHFRLRRVDDEVRDVVGGLLTDFDDSTVDSAFVDIDIRRRRRSRMTPDATYSVAFGDEFVYPSLHQGSLISHLLIEINARAVDATPSRLMIHAGTAGRTLIPGSSHSGKTTLTTALALRGAGFVADELSAMDPDSLTIAPYGKPVALRPDSAALFADRIARLSECGSLFELDERFVPPTELGLVAGEDVELEVVVFPTFAPGAETRLAEVSPAEALHALMAHVLGNPADPRAAFRSLERLVRRVRTYRIEFGNADQAAQMVTSLL